ncbi:MAG TPA: plasmid mobilization relaxosome protein MobC [Puia sp.]|nr:plasmid mobilization relaxosome protein MobC [Puia sp.]
MEQTEQSNYSCKKTVRFKPAELEQLESYFKSTTCRKLSDYIRRMVLKKPVVVKYRNQSADEFLSEMILLKKELNAIGNNFNQSVKKLHTLDDVPEFKSWIIQNETSKQILFNKINEIYNRMNQLYEIWSSK